MAGFVNPVWLKVLQGLNPFTSAPPVAPQPGVLGGAPYHPAQDPNQWDITYNAGHAVQAPLQAIANLFDAGPQALVSNPVGADIGQAVADQFSTPNQRAAAAKAGQPQPKPTAANNIFPTSYKDPRYQAANANASRITGVPEQLLNMVVMGGERTNAGVTSVAGANTPYQIIPSTRQGIIKKYGIDPWSSPENAALGAAYVLREHAGQNPPGPGQWTMDTAKRALGGYFGGHAGETNPFVHDANGQTAGGYVQQALGAKTPLAAPFLNPYNPEYDQAALAALKQGHDAALQPSHYETNIGPAPELPKPVDVPQTDFSASDQALQAMRPLEMTLHEQHQRETQGYLKGVSEALMQNPGNEGLGTFLMRLGGAALGGRVQGDAEVQRERDKFDEKLSQWQAALYTNDLTKARTHASELQAQAQQLNEWNQANYSTAYSRYLKSANIDIRGDQAVVQRLGADGKLTADVIPVKAAIDAAYAKDVAGVFEHQGGMAFAGNQQITGMENQLLGRAAIGEMARAEAGGNTQTADAAAAANAAFFGKYITDTGGTAELLGDAGAKSLEETVQKSLMGQQLMPGSQEWTAKHDKMVANQLALLGLKSPDMMKKMMQVGAAATSFEALDAARAARSTVSTDAKGQTTTRETQPTYTGAASDLFDGGSPGYTNQDLAPYGYTRQ